MDDVQGGLQKDAVFHFRDSHDGLPTCTCLRLSICSAYHYVHCIKCVCVNSLTAQKTQFIIPVSFCTVPCVLKAQHCVLFVVELFEDVINMCEWFLSHLR